MGSREDSSEQNAETADDNVRDTEERVPTTHDGPRRDQNRLGAAILRDIKS